MPGLALYDSNGATRAMTVAKDDGVILIFGRKEGPALIAKVLSEKGRASFGLLGKRTKASALLTVRSGEGVAVRLTDREEKTRAELHVKTDGSPRLAMRDKAGKVIWSAP